MSYPLLPTSTNSIELAGQALQTEATVPGQRVELMDRTDCRLRPICSRRLSIWACEHVRDEVAHRLRELVDASLAIVLITGWKLEVDTSSLAAFDFYLHKPFGPLKGYRQWSSGL